MLGLLAPALNDGMAGRLTNLLLDDGQYFVHCSNLHLVQDTGDQVVNQADEAAWGGERQTSAGLIQCDVIYVCNEIYVWLYNEAERK